MPLSPQDQQLHNAIQAGDLKAVQEALANGADIEAANKEGDTPLIAAAEKNYTAIVYHLIKQGANKEACNSDELTALHRAALSHSYQSLACLVEEGASVEALNTTGDTPLSLACFDGDFKSVRYLAEQGKADMTTCAQALLFARIAGSKGVDLVLYLLLHKTPFYENSAPIVWDSLFDGLIVDYFDELITPFWPNNIRIAARARHAWEALKSREFDLSQDLQPILDKWYEIHNTPNPGIIPLFGSQHVLHIAAVMGDLPLAQVYLAKLAPAEQCLIQARELSWQAELGLGTSQKAEEAAKQAQQALEKLHLDQHPLSIWWYDFFPLQLAAMFGHLELVKCFFEKTIALGYVVSYTKTTQLAAQNGHVAVVDYLVSHPCKEDFNKWTHSDALKTALVNKNFPMVRCLIENGVAVDSHVLKAFINSITEPPKSPIHKTTAALMLYLVQHPDFGKWNYPMGHFYNAIKDNPTYDKVRYFLLARGTILANFPVLGSFDSPVLLHAIAITHTHLHLLKPALVSGKWDINRLYIGLTPLGSAAYYGHVDLITLLRSYGADVNLPQKIEYTPLYKAAESNDVAAIRALCDPITIDKNGQTKLLPGARVTAAHIMRAIECHHVEATHTLLCYRVGIFRLEEGQKIYDAAMQTGEYEIIRLVDRHEKQCRLTALVEGLHVNHFPMEIATTIAEAAIHKEKPNVATTSAVALVKLLYDFFNKKEKAVEPQLQEPQPTFAAKELARKKESVTPPRSQNPLERVQEERATSPTRGLA